MTHEELRHTFDSLLGSSLSTSQLTRLANQAIRIAAGLLRSRFRRYLVILMDTGYTTESAAARCIEGLFLPQNGTPCARMAAYVRNEIEPHAPSIDGDCERVLRRCVFLSVQQSIPELLGEFDPQYRKILRMVGDTLAADGVYRRENGFFDDMVSRDPENALHRHLPAMTADEIIAQLSRRASPDDSTSTLVTHVFDILAESPQSRRVIPLGTLVTVLRDFFSLYWKFAVGNPEESEPAMFEDGDAERLIEPIVIDITEGILRNYTDRGLLGPEESAAYADAVREMLHDLATGSTPPWFEYHERLFPDIGYTDYRERHRGRFEYVLGSAKELFLHRCRKYFLSDFSATG